MYTLNVVNLLATYNPGQNYVGHTCRMHCFDDQSVFTQKQMFFGPNSTFLPSPHAMLFVRKGLLKSRPTWEGGGGGGGLGGWGEGESK